MQWDYGRNWAGTCKLDRSRVAGCKERGLWCLRPRPRVAIVAHGCRRRLESENAERKAIVAGQRPGRLVDWTRRDEQSERTRICGAAFTRRRIV
jgi:hypothetical protein